MKKEKRRMYGPTLALCLAIFVISILGLLLYPGGYYTNIALVVVSAIGIAACAFVMGRHWLDDVGKKTNNKIMHESAEVHVD